MIACSISSLSIFPTTAFSLYLCRAQNLVHNKIIRLNIQLTREELEQTANYLNAEFAGKSLVEIRAEIMRLMHEEKTLFDKLLQTAVILCSQSIEDDEDKLGEVYIDGTSNILTKTDFADLERLRELLRTIGEKSRLIADPERMYRPRRRRRKTVFRWSSGAKTARLLFKTAR